MGSYITYAKIKNKLVEFPYYGLMPEVIDYADINDNCECIKYYDNYVDGNPHIDIIFSASDLKFNNNSESVIELISWMQDSKIDTITKLTKNFKIYIEYSLLDKKGNIIKSGVEITDCLSFYSITRSSFDNKDYSNMVYKDVLSFNKILPIIDIRSKENKHVFDTCNDIDSYIIKSIKVLGEIETTSDKLIENTNKTIIDTMLHKHNLFLEELEKNYITIFESTKFNPLYKKLNINKRNTTVDLHIEININPNFININSDNDIIRKLISKELSYDKFIKHVDFSVIDDYKNYSALIKRWSMENSIKVPSYEELKWKYDAEGYRDRNLYELEINDD